MHLPWIKLQKKCLFGVLLLSFIVLPNGVEAQGFPAPGPPPSLDGHHRPPFNPQQFRQKFERFVTKRAGLTAKEAKAFYPQFHMMKDQERDIRSKIRRILHRAQSDRLKPADSQRMLREVLRLRRQENELVQRAYEGFARILPADKLMRVMDAERAFGREMFRQGPHHEPPASSGVKMSPHR